MSCLLMLGIWEGSLKRSTDKVKGFMCSWANSVRCLDLFFCTSHNPVTTPESPQGFGIVIVSLCKGMENRDSSCYHTTFVGPLLVKESLAGTYEVAYVVKWMLFNDGHVESHDDRKLIVQCDKIGRSN